MTIVYAPADMEVSDRDRRLSLFAGNLFVYSPRPSSLAFCEASRRVVEEMLGEEPGWAQQRMSETEFAALFETAAQTFRRIVPKLASAMVADLGCDERIIDESSVVPFYSR